VPERKVSQAVESARLGAKLGQLTGDTLGDIVLDRTNIVTAWQILNYVAVWGVYVERFGREPKSCREMSAVTPQSHATLSRWQTKFRKVFPEYESPAVLWSKVRDGLVVVDDPDHVTLQIGAAAL
jgi:hypothetical protein